MAARQNANRSTRAALSVIPAALELSEPALVVLASVPAWWRARATAAGLSREADLNVFQAVDAACPVPAGDLLLIPADETLSGCDPETLANAYLISLDAEVRAKHGRHYTPPLLANELWEQTTAAVGGYPDGLVLDPACGAGSLLFPVLREWLGRQSATPTETLRRLPSAVRGTDLDSAAVWLGSVLLASLLLPVWAEVRPSRRGPLPALLCVQDGLASASGGRPVAVVMNPPYGRVKLTPAERQMWGHVVKGHANLYAMFVAAAVASVTDGGVVSALVPSGWLGGDYSQRLRAYLASEAPPTSISFVSERAGVFSSGVLQETVLLTVQRGGPTRVVLCESITVNGHSERAAIGKAVLPDDPALPWLLPRNSEDLALLDALTVLPDRLSDHGWTVQTGPLVWNRHSHDITACPRENSVPIIWAADIDGGTVHQDKARDHQRYYRPTTDRNRASHVLSEPAVLVQRTTATEQERRLVAAILDAPTLAEWGYHVVVENHVNVLRAADPTSTLTPQVLWSLLNHPAVDRAFRCLSGSVAVSAYELLALPLPSQEMLARWAQLDGASLADEIDAAYGARRD